MHDFEGGIAGGHEQEGTESDRPCLHVQVRNDHREDLTWKDREQQCEEPGQETGFQEIPDIPSASAQGMTKCDADIT